MAQQITLSRVPRHRSSFMRFRRRYRMLDRSWDSFRASFFRLGFGYRFNSRRGHGSRRFCE